MPTVTFYAGDPLNKRVTAIKSRLLGCSAVLTFLPVQCCLKARTIQGCEGGRA